MQQLDLSLKITKPDVSAADVDLLCRRLKDTGWVYARQLRDRYDYNERTLRAIANASEGRILSGQKGYRLLDGDTTIEEVEHASSWLISQGKEMIRRGNAINRRYHTFNHQ